jgi:hypothetical protein
VVNSGLGGMLELIESVFTLLNVVFGIDEMFVNFLDNRIEPVDLFEQENLLKSHFGQFLFQVLRHNLDRIGNQIGDSLRLKHSLLLDRGHALFKLENKVLSVHQVTCHFLNCKVQSVDLLK